jgi:hypothetical protein
MMSEREQDRNSPDISLPQLFPPWTNRLPLVIALAGVGLIVGAVFFFWHFGSPKFTDVGYRPDQPVPYSHKLHAGDLGIDCRYCHTGVETGPHAGVPPTQTCMNCHKLVLPESPKLLPVRESWATRVPIAWVKVHDLPQYAYFNHGVHVRAGVGCESCHGNVAEMEKVTLRETLSMSWCLDCHRNPDPHLRRPEDVTKMNWTPGPDHASYVARWKTEHKIIPPEDCAACHR